jgi:hypothetical protein
MIAIWCDTVRQFCTVQWLNDSQTFTHFLNIVGTFCLLSFHFLWTPLFLASFSHGHILPLFSWACLASFIFSCLLTDNHLTFHAHLANTATYSTHPAHHGSHYNHPITNVCSSHKTCKFCAVRNRKLLCMSCHFTISNNACHQWTIICNAFIGTLDTMLNFTKITFCQKTNLRLK